MDDLRKASIELNDMLNYLHSKRDWVSLNTLRKKFPVVSRNRALLKHNGVRTKLIANNTYVIYNKFVKFWQPMRECYHFNKCSCNNCPLDEEVSKRVVLENDDKCLLKKNVPLRV